MADDYVSSGWVVLGRNVRIGGAELDLVVERDGVLRFVEVRLRDPNDPLGIESITTDKRRRLVRGARAFLAQYEDVVEEASFDVVLVSLTATGWHQERWLHAFDA